VICTDCRLSHKRSIFAGEMHLMICIEWAGDHHGLGLMQNDPLLTNVCAKKAISTFFAPSHLDL